MVNFCCFFPHHWGPFQVLQAKPWGIHTLTDFLWSIVTFFQLFFRRYCFCVVKSWKIADLKLLMCCLCLVQIGSISALLTRPALARVRGGHLRSTGTLGAEDRHPTGAQEGGDHLLALSSSVLDNQTYFRRMGGFGGGQGGASPPPAAMGGGWG